MSKRQKEQLNKLRADHQAAASEAGIMPWKYPDTSEMSRAELVEGIKELEELASKRTERHTWKHRTGKEKWIR